MTDEELLMVFKEFGKKVENRLGDMSDLSEIEELFIYFKGGIEYAASHLTHAASDFPKPSGSWWYCKRCGSFHFGACRNDAASA